MKYIDLTLPSPAANLACDEALLDLADSGAGGEVLRFWEPSEPFVVLGYANQAATEVDLPACRARKIPVLRRCSGGGTVLQGAGCLNYSVILRIPEAGLLHSIKGTNTFVLERQCAALAPLLPSRPAIKGQTDLVLGDLKFSGNAQRRKREFLLFHGTFLLNFDLTLIGQCLRMPPKQPEYRKGRSHSDFLTNTDIDDDAIKQALRKEWSADDEFANPPLEEIKKLVETRYASEAWNLRC
jgi:lipoate-protein ligase A